MSSLVTNEEVILLKRLPRRLPKRKNDVYITRKTDFKAQLARCENLLFSNYNEIFIHGLGAAISRSINIALQLKLRSFGSLDVSCQTDTVHLTDDLVCDEERSGGQPRTQTRLNSAVHIRVFRPQVPLALSQGSTVCSTPNDS